MRNEWKYTQTDKSRVIVREIEIETGKGGEAAVIVHFTDSHFNGFTENDLANPVLASTHEFRKWGANGANVPNCQRCFDYAESIGADQVVITGDVLDFLAEGSIKLMKEHIWDKYPDTIVTMGNHDATRKVQGKVEDTSTVASRMRILQDSWKHDIYYSSYIIKDKAMIIQLDNSSEFDVGHKGFFDCQIESLKRDITIARERGLKALIFYHSPLCTKNPDAGVTLSSYVGDKNVSAVNFNTQIALWNNEPTLAVYDILTNNADVVAGCFCGHFHSDFYTEIKAKTADGEDTVIPQYVLIGTPYDKGHVLKILVK